MSDDRQGGSRALVTAGSAAKVGGATGQPARLIRSNRPQAPFVVQLLACRAGLNGYRARRRADASIGAATYEAVRDATIVEPPKPDRHLERTLTVA